MAARKRIGTRHVPWDERTKERIQAGMLVYRLQSHVNGEVDLKPTQVQAALGLLRKVIPDLSSSTNTNVNLDLANLSSDDLAKMIEDLRSRVKPIDITPIKTIEHSNT